MINILLPTHPPRQIDVLREKMGMDVNPMSIKTNLNKKKNSHNWSKKQKSNVNYCSSQSLRLV